MEAGSSSTGTGTGHMQSIGHVTGASSLWGFGRDNGATCRGKSRGDGWDRYTKSVTSSREWVWEHLLDRGKFGEPAQSLNYCALIDEHLYLCLVIDAKPLYL